MGKFVRVGILFIIILNCGVYAQNLLPNENFSEQLICFEYHQKCAPMGWRLTSADPPTYYREFKENDTSVFSAWTAFIAFSFFEKQYREYLQAPLLCPLKKGEKYTFSISLKPEKFAIKEFGVKFNDTAIITGSNSLIIDKPSIIFSNNNYIIDKHQDWTTLTSDYYANGKEKYILLGNFLPDEDTKYKSFNSKKITAKIAYFVHHISFKPAKDTTLCDCSALIDRLRKDRYRHTLFTAQFFQDSIAMNISGKAIPIEQKTEQITTIQMNNDTVTMPVIYFRFDRYNLDNKAVLELNTILKYINQHSCEKIYITGHTDCIGSAKYNNSLSLKRAHAVKSYFIENGIQPEKLITIGKGESEPVETNNTPEGRKYNRRVVINCLTKY